MFAGLGLTACDLVHHVLGVRGVIAGILVGTALSVLFALSEILDPLVCARLRHRSRLAAVGTSNAVGFWWTARGSCRWS